MFRTIPGRIFIGVLMVGALSMATLLVPHGSAHAWSTFGGPILTTMVCTCTPSVWLVIVGPPRPAALSYVSGSQGFLSYNMPFARYTLGLYIPGAPSCFMGYPPACGPVTQGTITPIVGSSPL